MLPYSQSVLQPEHLTRAEGGGEREREEKGFSRKRLGKDMKREREGENGVGRKRLGKDMDLRQDKRRQDKNQDRVQGTGTKVKEEGESDSTHTITQPPNLALNP